MSTPEEVADQHRKKKAKKRLRKRDSAAAAEGVFDPTQAAALDTAARTRGVSPRGQSPRGRRLDTDDAGGGRGRQMDRATVDAAREILQRSLSRSLSPRATPGRARGRSRTRGPDGASPAAAASGVFDPTEVAALNSAARSREVSPRGRQISPRGRKMDRETIEAARGILQRSLSRSVSPRPGNDRGRGRERVDNAASASARGGPRRLSRSRSRSVAPASARSRPGDRLEPSAEGVVTRPIELAAPPDGQASSAKSRAERKKEIAARKKKKHSSAVATEPSAKDDESRDAGHAATKSDEARGGTVAPKGASVSVAPVGMAPTAPKGASMSVVPVGMAPAGPPGASVHVVPIGGPPAAAAAAADDTGLDDISSRLLKAMGSRPVQVVPQFHPGQQQKAGADDTRGAEPAIRGGVNQDPRKLKSAIRPEGGETGVKKRKKKKKKGDVVPVVASKFKNAMPEDFTDDIRNPPTQEELDRRAAIMERKKALKHNWGLKKASVVLPEGAIPAPHVEPEAPERDNRDDVRFFGSVQFYVLLAGVITIAILLSFELDGKEGTGYSDKKVPVDEMMGWTTNGFRGDPTLRPRIANTTAEQRLHHVVRSINAAETLHSTRNPCYQSDKPMLVGLSKTFCLPYTYMIGAPWSGGFDLWRAMLAHPEVVPPSKDGWTRSELQRGGWRGTGQVQPRFWSENIWDGTSLGYYAQLFAPLASLIPLDHKLTKITMDGSLDMLTTRRTKFSNAKALRYANPDARIIVVLREPADRAWADYWQFVTPERKNPFWEHRFKCYNKGEPSPEHFHLKMVKHTEKIKACLETLSLVECMYDENLNKRDAEVCPGGRPMNSLYAPFLLHWLEQFPREQLLVLQTENMLAHPRQSLQRVFEFLRLTPNALKNPDVWERAVGTLLQKRGLGVVDAETPIHTNSNATVGEMLPETRLLLDEFYAPFNKMLLEEVGIDAPEVAWGKPTGKEAAGPPVEPWFEPVWR